MTLDDALARATELGHDMSGQEPQRGHGGQTVYVCNNGHCWCYVRAWRSGAIDGDALTDFCELKGQWAAEKEREGQG